MRKSLFVVVALVVLGPSVVAAAPVSGADRHVEFVIDVSGSMGGSRIEQARTALTSAIDGLRDSDAAALRSFSGSCSSGTRLEVDFGLDNRPELHDAVAGLRTGGSTPTPAALQAAATDLHSVSPSVIVLVSDGQSTCGDPCPVAQQIADDLGTSFRAITVGFQAPDTAQGELQCIAEVTGGQYFAADDADSLADAIDDGLAAARYVAFGDSYSSGEGADDYQPGTDTDYSDDPGNGCRLSDNAYPQVIADSNLSPDTLDFVACSGARTWHFYEAQKPVPHDPVHDEQFLEASLPAGTADPSIELVTVTIGGNDMGFAEILERCVKSTGFNPCSGRSDEDVDQAMARLAGEDVPDGAFGNDKTRPLSEVYGDIRARAPEARVLVLGYPQFFKSSGTLFNRCSGVMKVDQLWVNKKVQEFNDFLQEQVEAVGFEFVPTSDAFESHRLCEIGGGEEREWFRDLQPFDDPQAQFHPDADGHAAMAGEALATLRTPRPGAEVTLESGESAVFDVLVEAGRRAVAFFTSWPGSDVELVATSPSGVTHSRQMVHNGTQRTTRDVFEQLLVDSPEPGTWTVELVGLELDAGGESVRFTTAQLSPENKRPVSVAVASASGRTVHLDGSASFDPDGELVEYLWFVSHPDGSTTEVPGVRTAVHLDGFGRFGVTLRVIDDRGKPSYDNVEGGVAMVYDVTREGDAPAGEQINPVQSPATVPIMWRLTLNGEAVTTVDAVTAVLQTPIHCSTREATGPPADANGELVRNATGRWQFNWQSTRNEAGECVQVSVEFADGQSLDTSFEVR